MDLVKKFECANKNASVVIQKCREQANDSNDVVCLLLHTAVFILVDTLLTVGENDREKMLVMWDEIVQYIDVEVDYGFEKNE